MITYAVEKVRLAKSSVEASTQTQMTVNTVKMQGGQSQASPGGVPWFTRWSYPLAGRWSLLDFLVAMAWHAGCNAKSTERVTSNSRDFAGNKTLCAVSRKHKLEQPVQASSAGLPFLVFDVFREMSDCFGDESDVAELLFVCRISSHFRIKVSYIHNLKFL